MNLKALRRTWNRFGETDPLWAILTDPHMKGARWQTEEFFGTGEAEVRALMEQIASLGLQVSRGRALDFGCGVGRLTQALARHFAEVDGVDIASSMLDLAREYNRHGEKCRYHLNERDDLTAFPDGHFDLILSLITLQHMDPEYSRRYIREFLRTLRTPGVLVFNLPSGHTAEFERRLRQRMKRVIPEPLLAVYRKVRYGWKPTMEMHATNSREVAVLVEESGGKLVHVEEDWRDAQWISLRYYAVRRGPVAG